MENLLHINFLAVFIAIIINQVIGALWYSPILFQKIWMKELNLNPETIDKKRAAISMVLAFLYSIFSFLLLAYFFVAVQSDCAAKGLMVGFLLGLFTVIQMGINATFEGKGLKLFMINALYPLISYSIGGLIIGSF